ncbi:MAG TPA: DUF2339 domain-containing protein [Gaiellaceae bacterium]|nr:DUF2339 domain-containing protein [Gaiellaceae bacterium]
MTGFLLILLVLVVIYFVLRIGALERRVGLLERPSAPVAEPSPAPRPAPAPPKQPAAAAPAPVPVPRPAPLPRPAFDWRGTLGAVDLMGAKALAFAGGVVTMLGVVFFFVLAVNRGWIGPELRVACGGLASALVFGGGLWLYRGYGRTYSALAATGTGIAGAYATVLAAVSLYDLISKPVALVAAGVIAAVGVAVSLAWSEEIVAGFGLIGAMVVPATLVFQGGLQQIGTAFVAVVFAGAAIVAVRQRWWKLLQVAALVSVPQAIAQIAQANAPHVGIVLLALAFWLLYLGAGLAFQLRIGRPLVSAPASFLTGGAVFGAVSAGLLYDGRDLGVALLVVAGVYIVLAAALFRRLREPSLLLGALGLAAAAVGVAQVLSGSSVTYAWAVEAAVLAWLTSRVRDGRFQLPAIAYLVLATVHALAFEASPHNFFTEVVHPAKGAPALVAVALAAALFGRVRRSWEREAPKGILRALEPLLSWLDRREREVDIAAYSLAVGLATYAAALGILELFGFQNGHVVVTCVSSAAALGLLAAGYRRAAFAWLAAVAAKAALFDVLTLTHTRYGISLAVVGATLLAAGLAREITHRAPLTPEGAAATVLSLPFGIASALVLVAGDNAAVLVAAGAFYTAFAAATFRLRDLSTLLWVLGLTVAGYGEAALLDGVWLVLAYTATASALAVVATTVRERRLQAASLVYLVAAALITLVGETPPSHFVTELAHPGHGLASLALLIAGVVTLAWSLDWSEHFRVQAIWAAGALAVYGASLAILEAAQRVSPEDVHTNFQRGQAAVSALWGILALISLYAGLRKQRRLLRVGGFVLFGISLGKIFLFDLPSLSSAQRALSFLAVGGVLLLGGFFYQRLSSQFDERTAG